MGRYSITFDSLSVFDTEDGRNVARAVVSVYRDGKYLGELYPRRDYYYESQQPMTIPGVRSSMEDDFYVLLVDWQPVSTAGATFKVYHNPLVNWLWLGGFVFILGTLVAAWPDKDPEQEALRSQPGRCRGQGLRKDERKHAQNPIYRAGCYWRSTLLAVLSTPPAALAQQPTPSDDEVNAIAKQLFCPVCENTPLDVCPTQACAQWRELIREKLAAGWSEAADQGLLY